MMDEDDEVKQVLTQDKYESCPTPPMPIARIRCIVWPGDCQPRRRDWNVGIPLTPGKQLSSHQRRPLGVVALSGLGRDISQTVQEKEETN